MLGLPDALVFDLDDTLLDYSASGAQVWDELFQEYAPRFGVESKQLSRVHQRVSDWYWADPERHRLGRQNLRTSRRQVLQLVIEQLGLDCSTLGDEMADAFTLKREPRIRPFPGVMQTLRVLKERGIRMALVTNGSSEFQRNKVRRFDLDQVFMTIIIEEEFGVGKPDRKVFLSALAGLGAEPSGAWMVGDDLARDIQPALNLGLEVFWVDHQGVGLPADMPPARIHILETVNDLLNPDCLDTHFSLSGKILP